MNILIPDSWLREYLKTEATPEQIANALSLHSASVEKIEQVGKDFVYTIEITTNRVDMASIYGIARESAAALKQMKTKAVLKSYKTYSLNSKANTKYLQVQTNSKLNPRFSTILCRIVENRKSPNWIKDRLMKTGINSHNNIIDVTNFVMLEMGQPMHAFDFDKLEDQKIMKIRESKYGEAITTLDGVKRKLSGGDIVIEDGIGRLIDLCGIKGGENTAIDNQTKNVLLFTQKYDPVKIRKTIQSTGIRTKAATLFEKGIDAEQTVIALQKAYKLLQEIAGAKLIGGLIDIYAEPYKAKKIKLEIDMVQKITGVDIKTSKIINILQSLGFATSLITHNTLLITIPSWRADDIEIQEDIIEEIIRLYGYFNIPSYIAPFNKALEEPITSQHYYWKTKVKNLLKHLGFNEIYSYSLISNELLDKTKELKQKAVKIANPLTVETEYLRPSLMPSILQVIKQNKNRISELRIFELANIYLSNNKIGELPIQKAMLALASNSISILELKAILEQIFYELKIFEYRFEQKNICAKINLKNKKIGTLSTKDNIIIAEIDFNLLTKHARKYQQYLPISEYPSLVEDMTFVFPPRTHIGPVIEKIKSASQLIKKAVIHDQYENNFTFRITYQSHQKSLSSKDVKNIRKKIGERIEKNFNAKLKAK